MRYKLMTVGDGDPDHFDPFSWTPPTQKEVSWVPMTMNLNDLYHPDGFLVKYLGDYEYADLVYEFNDLDYFPGEGVHLEQVVNYALSQSYDNRLPLVNRMTVQIKIPDVTELRGWVLRNRSS